MAPERLSRLERRVLRWLAAEEQRTRGTMAASHQNLVRACQPCTELLIPDLYDGVLDRPKPPLSSLNRTFQ